MLFIVVTHYKKQIVTKNNDGIMKSRNYYESAKFDRHIKITKDMNDANEPELIKEFIGKEQEHKDRLLRQIIKLKNKSEVKRAIKDFEIFIEPMEFDLLNEFYNLNEENLKQLDNEWLPEFRNLAQNILWKIPQNERFIFLEKQIISDEYQLHLSLIQLIQNQR